MYDDYEDYFDRESEASDFMDKLSSEGFSQEELDYMVHVWAQD